MHPSQKSGTAIFFFAEHGLKEALDDAQNKDNDTLKELYVP